MREMEVSCSKCKCADNFTFDKEDREERRAICGGCNQAKHIDFAVVNPLLDTIDYLSNEVKELKIVIKHLKG